MKRESLVSLALLSMTLFVVGCTEPTQQSDGSGSGTGGGVSSFDGEHFDPTDDEEADTEDHDSHDHDHDHAHEDHADEAPAPAGAAETKEAADAEPASEEDSAAAAPAVPAKEAAEPATAVAAAPAAPPKKMPAAKPPEAEPAPAAPAPAAPAPAAPAKSVAAAPAAAPAPAAPAKPAAAAGPKGSTGDWSMWGGSPGRNMISAATGIDFSFQAAETAEEGKNLLWTAPLGSQTYGNPIVAEGKVFVGTNNGAEYRPKHVGDRGCILAFNEADGEFLWQLTREKLPQGRVNDWPEQGICSTPCIENGRLYVATNRCEIMCIDIEGFHDGENDGKYQDEVDTEKEDADIIWSFDMIDELGVFPHNLATSSPVIYGDLLLLVTSNGVDEAHLEVPSPRAPSFIAVNKNTGELVWENDFPSLESKAPAPFDNILHGQWGSPAVGEVNGKALAFMPGGDGVLYTFDAANGELVWWFDLNPKESLWELGGRGTRNAIISTPVFYDNSVILAVGQDPEHGEGVGHLYRIDATKTGDLSTHVADGDGYKPNPNSGEIWHVGGIDADGSITGEENGLIFRRTISTFSVANGLVYAPDLSGFLHCIDFKTGEKKWVYDSFAAVWGSPMVLDGAVLLGDEDGEMALLPAGDRIAVDGHLPGASASAKTPAIDISKRPKGVSASEIVFAAEIPSLTAEQLPAGIVVNYNILAGTKADLSDAKPLLENPKKLISGRKSKGGSSKKNLNFSAPDGIPEDAKYLAIEITNGGEVDLSGVSFELAVEAWAVRMFQSSIYSTPTVANGRMYVSDRSRLYAFKVE